VASLAICAQSHRSRDLLSVKKAGALYVVNLQNLSGLACAARSQIIRMSYNLLPEIVTHLKAVARDQNRLLGIK